MIPNTIAVNIYNTLYDNTTIYVIEIAIRKLKIIEKFEQLLRHAYIKVEVKILNFHKGAS